MVSKHPHRLTSWAALLAIPALLVAPMAAFAQDTGTAESPPATPGEAAADAATDAAATDGTADSDPPPSDAAADTPAPAAAAAPASAAPATAAPAAEAPPATADAEAATDDDAEGGFEDEGDGAEEFSDEDLGGFDEASDEPDLGERRLVAYVATGVAAAAFVTGGVFAFLAWQQYQCVADIAECNKTLDDPVIGEELFDARAEIEYKALAADMAFLFGAAAALVAGTGYVRGFIFTGEDDGADAGADEEITLNGLPPLPRVATQSESGERSGQ